MAITRVRGGFKATYGGKTRTFKTRSAAENWAEKVVDPSAVVRKSDKLLLARRKEKARDPALGRETGWASRKKTNKKKTRSRGKSSVY